MKARFTTVPIRCTACGQQTHKTLASVKQQRGMVCECGAYTEVDVAQFTAEIEKQEERIKDFGRSKDVGRSK
jgi:transcription elongation factor Elf1